MSDPIKPGAVLFARALAPVAAFYEALAELRRTHEDETAVRLETDGFELIVHRIPDHFARDIVIADPPARRQASAHKLVFPVADLAVARERAAAHGGTIDPTEAEWRWGGFRACDGHDPEGNCIQLRAPER